MQASTRLRPVVAVLLAFVLDGCSSSSPPRCSGLVTTPEIGVCVTPQSGWAKVPGRSEESAAIAGTVLEVGEGGLPDECQQPLTAYWWNIASPESAWWFRVSDAQGEVWTVGGRVPESSPPVTVGQAVTVELSWYTCCFASPVTSVAVRDENAALLLWIGQGGGGCQVGMPADLGSYAPSRKVCAQDDGCGEWAAYDLVVSSPGASATLPYGGEVVIGGMRFVHGGYSEGSGETGCPDWCPGESHLAALASR
jgi:hypothetical protein